MVRWGVGFLALLVLGAWAQEGFRWPRQILFASTEVGTAGYSLLVAWSAEFTAATGVQLRVSPGATPTLTGWLLEGRVEFASAPLTVLVEALDGEAGYRPGPLRVVYPAILTPWGLMTRGDSPYRRIQDIGPGVRLAWPPFSYFHRILDGLLACRGLTREQARLVPVANYSANSRVIAEGGADIAFTSPVSDVNLEVEGNPRGIRWLPVPTAQEDRLCLQRWQRAYPLLALVRPADVGAQSARGVRMFVIPSVYYSRADVSEELVYHLVKWLDENHALYRDKHAMARFQTLDSLRFLVESMGVPLHPGTVRYLKEKGLWTAEMERKQGAAVRLVDQYATLYERAASLAKSRRIPTDPANEAWQRFWREFLAQNKVPRFSEAWRP
ncbi:MAG: TRAP transporter substrate-binding protein [Thermus sp.]|uniref:TAXI family TRAP transporter solute-binding subunit n=1 Tax=Thermus sp. TaxID=275 RepID=UPI0025DC85D3|nr:TAXI family TRAP transporter solute-binding subunit [Thermus sp.]MCS6867710.1 TRAP transporter substrate-binding protein [Thermus sp.]MCS7219216.1 TRAP transporter substrate-binding protein [Thermus sp.]MDW8018272.1 TAXI family TRAP transporter solute-binding subunit [Thermus sp.]MDW8358792.1 TAXI family TRAP transporter solute-binding subunit [Thermus sp.]